MVVFTQSTAFKNIPKSNLFGDLPSPAPQQPVGYYTRSVRRNSSHRDNQSSGTEIDPMVLLLLSMFNDGSSKCCPQQPMYPQIGPELNDIRFGLHEVKSTLANMKNNGYDDSALILQLNQYHDRCWQKLEELQYAIYQLQLDHNEIYSKLNIPNKQVIHKFHPAPVPQPTPPPAPQPTVPVQPPPPPPMHNYDDDEEEEIIEETTYDDYDDSGDEYEEYEETTTTTDGEDGNEYYQDYYDYETDQQPYDYQQGPEYYYDDYYMNKENYKDFMNVLKREIKK